MTRNGGYGHPDHIHAHEVTMAAVAASAGTEYPGEPWTVPKVYWTVISRTAMGAGLDALDDVPDEWIRVSIDDVPFGYPDDAIDAIIDVPDQLPAKVAALRAHATQVTVAPDGRSCGAVEQHRAADRRSRALHPGVRRWRAPATTADGKPICWRA